MDEDETRRLVRDLADLKSKVRSLRLLVLRVAAGVAILLIVVGAVLPAWRDRTDGEYRTYNLVNTGFRAFGDGDGEGLAVIFGIGFLGLLVVLVLLCGVLANSVLGTQGRSDRAMVRMWIVSLAIVGTLVGVLLSIIAWSADDSRGTGGFGPLVTLGGVALALALLTHKPMHDLWVDQSPYGRAVGRR